MCFHLVCIRLILTVHLLYQEQEFMLIFCGKKVHFIILSNHFLNTASVTSGFQYMMFD